MHSLKSVVLTQFGADFNEEQIFTSRLTEGLEGVQEINRHINCYWLNTTISGDNFFVNIARPYS